MKRFKLSFFAILLTVSYFKIGSVNGIVNGNPATLDKFKYVVSVQADNLHVCGGGLIGEQHVLTAAHCVIGEDNLFKKSKFTILARVINLKFDIPPAIEEAVQTIYVPKEFKRLKREVGVFIYPEIADIAILKLKNKLEFGTEPLLAKLVLPKRHGSNFLRYQHSKAILAGFGSENSIRESKTDLENLEIYKNNCIKLNFADVIVNHKTACKGMVHFPVTDKHFCAQIVRNVQRKNFEGACNGDEGSPLVVDGNTVIGVLAQIQYNCNEKFSGSLYTRVSSFIVMIKKALEDEIGAEVRIANYRRVTGEVTGDIGISIGTSQQPEELVEITSEARGQEPEAESTRDKSMMGALVVL